MAAGEQSMLRLLLLLLRLPLLRASLLSMQRPPVRLPLRPHSTSPQPQSAAGEWAQSASRKEDASALAAGAAINARRESRCSRHERDLLVSCSPRHCSSTSVTRCAWKGGFDGDAFFFSAESGRCRASMRLVLAYCLLALLTATMAVSDGRREREEEREESVHRGVCVRAGERDSAALSPLLALRTLSVLSAACERDAMRYEPALTSPPPSPLPLQSTSVSTPHAGVYGSKTERSFIAIKPGQRAAAHREASEQQAYE